VRAAANAGPDRLCRLLVCCGSRRRAAALAHQLALLDRSGWQSSFNPATPILLWVGTAVLRWILAPLTLVWVLALASSVAQAGWCFPPRR